MDCGKGAIAVNRQFVVVYEATADFTTATELADRVLIEQVPWLDEALLDTQRRWIREESPDRPFTWKSIPERAREAGIHVRGHFAGEPGLPDARAARRAIAYILHRMHDIDAIVLIRDADNQSERVAGLEQARREHASECQIVLGVAVCARECWVICGFLAGDESERRQLASQRQLLGTDPSLRSEGISRPKRVLQSLTGGDWDRERACWTVTPLALLRERGGQNGLAAYLGEVEGRLVPLLTSPR